MPLHLSCLGCEPLRSSDAPPPGSSSRTVSAWIDSLPADSSATFTLVVQINSSTPLQTIINNAVSIAPAANLSNSSASFSTTVLYTPTFSNLTVQQIIVGTSTTTVSGQLAYNTIIPVGQRVSITLNRVTQV